MKGGKSTGANKAVVLLVALFAVLVALVGWAAYFVYTEGSYQTRYLTLVSDEKLISQEMATQALRAAQGEDAAFVQLRRLKGRFEDSLKVLREGDPDNGLPALSEKLAAAGMSEPFDRLQKSWAGYRTHVDTILKGRDVIQKVAEHVQIIRETMPDLLEVSDELVRALVRADAPAEQVYLLARQLMIAERIELNLNKVLSGKAESATAADQFGRDAALFGRVLDALAKGNATMGIERLTQPEAVEKLREAAVLYAAVRENAGAILDAAPNLYDINEAAGKIESAGAAVLEAADGLERAVLRYGARLDLVTMAAAALGALAILDLLLIAWLLVRAAKRREQLAEQQNRRNQEAILRLLDEMTTLAEGDLTVQATVTEDITGAIADSVNYSIDALRNLVATINATAEQVAASAEKTRAITQRLADASNYQAREIASASAAVADMADSIEEVSGTAANAADVAQRSVEIAHEGANAVSRTIEGMGTIREQIQETSKRIKRLGESSQEIGDIVSLINEIADQTNILALNAAIQASTAGEAGRGFAVVADEVQRLAERASNATKQIEALVKTIQADTHEAVISMEQSTANVVSGARLAEEAGESLGKIEDVSNELAGLIQSISMASRQQASAAASITNTMSVIQEITLQTSEGTTETAEAVAELAELAVELRRSVAGFKLPEDMDQSAMALQTMALASGPVTVSEAEAEAEDAEEAPLKAQRQAGS